MTAIETFKGIAHPWLCDIMGHLNTRNYMAMFDNASMYFLSLLGYDFKEALTGTAPFIGEAYSMTELGGLSFTFLFAEY